MIIYGSSMSPFVRKVLAFAAEKGIAFEARPIGIGDQDPEFRAASPFGKMPALADGDYRLADSSAIIHYLEAKHPEPPLIPQNAEARGKVIWFEEFGDTMLGACGAKIFFNRVVAPIFLKRSGDEGVAAVAEQEELPRLLEYLEGVVSSDGFLVGDRLTLADLAVASPLANLGHIGVTIDPQRFPRTASYVEGILNRPSFHSLLERERKFLERVRS